MWLSILAELSGALLVLGMTGTLTPLVPVLAACVMATVVPTAIGSAPIYDTLRERMEQAHARTSMPGEVPR